MNATQVLTIEKKYTSPFQATRLSRFSLNIVLVACLVFSAVFSYLFFVADNFSITKYLLSFFLSFAITYIFVVTVLSFAVEGKRRAVNRFFSLIVLFCFMIAVLPLISVILTTIIGGAARFDVMFFSYSMRNVTGSGGGALHAIMGTLQITFFAALISVPIGIATAVFLLEYGDSELASAVKIFTDVMTGIPSIVAGLFAFSLFSLLFGPGVRMGFGGAVALSVLMIPVVIKSSLEILKLVPQDLVEASLALGVSRWRTIIKVVLPTAAAGLVTAIMLAISRVIGETAPLLIIAGFNSSLNYNMFAESVMTLPVFVYNSYANPGADANAYLERAWAGALTLIIIVMLLNIVARLVAKYFSRNYK